MSKTDLIYGYHAVKTVLRTRPKDIVRLFIQDSKQDTQLNEINALSKEYHVVIELISKEQLVKKIGDKATHQGIVAECKPLSSMTEKELLDVIENAKDPVLLLILDGVQDPHNLGACLRSANAFGVTAVIAPKDRAVSLTDTVRKVACGAAEQTAFISVTNLNRTLKQLQEAGVWLVGFDESATLTVTQVDMKGKIGIVMGSEGDGLRRLTKESCDYLAKIPMMGMIESLNVSVATGIALYEARRQRI